MDARLDDGSPTEAERLLALLRTAQDPARRRAARELARLRPPGLVERLADLLTHPREGTRLGVVLCAAELRSEGVEILIRALTGDPLRRVRGAAARELGRLRAPEAVPSLCRALRDRSQVVRETAAEALAGIRDLRAVDPLAESLNRPGMSEGAREAVAEALGALASARGTAALVTALEDDAARVRIAAAIALRGVAAGEPTVALRAALAPLAALERNWLQFGGRKEFRATLKAIETATAPLKDLPLPAAGADEETRSLPLPASGPEVAGGQQPAAEGSAVSAQSPGLLQRLLRAWPGRRAE